jgi:membrane protease YdiL (CAAX protease family)
MTKKHTWQLAQRPLTGLALAAGCFTRTFRGPRERFWSRMTVTGASLGALSLLSEPEHRKLSFRVKHLIEGGAIATGLYGIFRIGDKMARRIMPNGAGDIQEIYDLRSGQDPLRVGARLAFVIGPAEELFWRGHVQRRLSAEHGKLKGALEATLAYGGVHLASGNPTLVGAASVAGAWWSALAALGVDMESLILSHVIWDVVIFLIAPTVPQGEAV